MTEQPPSAPGGYVIEVEFDDGKEAQRAYDAIEGLLGEMGQLGTLGMRPLPSALASTGEQPDKQCPACRWHEGEDPAEWFREEVSIYMSSKPWPETTSAAPPSPAAVVDYTERAREVIGRSCGEVVDYIHRSELLVNWRVNGRLIVNIAAALSAAASERDAAPPPSVVDYTERALTVARDAIEGVPSHLLPYRINSEEIAQAIAPDIADALSERDAAYLAKLSECEDFRAGFETVERQCRDANRALRQARSEHDALLARLREPDVREALEVELRPYLHEMLTLEARDTVLTAALTKIAEMLK